MTSRVLVTGAGGFLGARLVERLVEDSSTEVVATFRTRPPRPLSRAPSNLHYVLCDLSSPSDVARLFSEAKFETVVHAAAALPVSAAGYLPRSLRDNVSAQAQLVAECLARDVARFVFCSTISVYGSASDFDEDVPPRPESAYGRAKYAAEQILQMATSDSASMSGVSLRLAGLHGRGRASGVVHSMIAAACEGRAISIAEPDSRFRLCFVDDAIDAIVCAMRLPSPPRYACYNVAGREIYTLRELAEAILRLVGAPGEIRETRPSPARDMAMPTDRAERDLAYRPRALDEHLSAMIADTRARSKA